MGFEDERDDFWRGRDGGPHSKLNFLRVLVECGAVMTARAEVEIPYDGATDHAELLALEGLAERAPEQPFKDAVIWLPTRTGRRFGGAASC